MKVIIYNTKFNDNIEFEIEELTEEVRQDILDQVHTRGWNDNDCYSELVK